MSVQMGGGQTHVENRLSWRYELMLPTGANRPVTIGPAHVRVDGHDVASNSVAVRIGASNAPPTARGAARPGGGLIPRGLFPGLLDDGDDDNGAVTSSPGMAFIRAVADKPRAFVGEQVTVTWYLYLTEPQNNFRPLTQPRTDGFWAEELPSTNPQGRLSFTDRVEGRPPISDRRARGQGALPAGARQAQRDADGGGGVAARLLRPPGSFPAPQVRPAHHRGFAAAAGRPARWIQQQERRSLPGRGRRRSDGGGSRRCRHAHPDGEGDRQHSRAGDAAASAAAWLESVRAQIRRYGRARRGGHGEKNDRVVDPSRAGGTDADPLLRHPHLRSVVQALRRSADAAHRDDRERRGHPPRCCADSRRALAGRGHRERPWRGDSSHPRPEPTGAGRGRGVFPQRRVRRDGSRSAGRLPGLGRERPGAAAPGRRRGARPGAAGCARWPTSGCATRVRTPRRDGSPSFTWRSTGCCATCFRSASAPRCAACRSTSCARCWARRGVGSAEVDRIVRLLEAGDEARFAPGAERVAPGALAATLAESEQLIHLIETAPLGSGASS